MADREKLIELISAVSCNGNGESLGSCPDRKFGLCGEMADLSYCVIQNLANHLIANGVTVRERGRWIEDYETFVNDNGYESEPIHTGFVCSVCGRHSLSIEPFCHCGAIMDGGNGDEKMR